MNRCRQILGIVLFVTLGVSAGVVRAEEDKSSALFRANKLVDLAELSRKDTDYEKAEYFYKRALGICVEHRPGTSTIPNLLYQLGQLGYEAGMITKARDYYLRAHAAQAALGPETTQMATLLYELAHMHDLLDDLEQAESYIIDAAALAEKRSPKGALILKVWRLQAMIAIHGGDATQAEVYLLKVLNRQHKDRPRSIELADALDDLGMVNLRAGLPKRSEAYYKQSLTLREVLAPSSYSYARVQNVLGYLYIQMDQLDRAEGALEKASERFMELDPYGMDIIVNQRYLGRLLLLREHFSAAETAFKKAVEVATLRVPHSLPQAAAYRDLGYFYAATKSPLLAQRYLKLAFSTYETWMGSIGWSAENIAYVSRRRDEFIEAHFASALIELDDENEEGVLAALQRLRNFKTFAMLTDQASFAIGWSGDLADRRIELVKDRERTLGSIEKWELPENLTHVTDLRAYLGQLQEKWTGLRSELKKENAAIGELYAPSRASLKSIKGELSKSELLLSYTIGEEETVMLVITRKRPYVRTVRIPITRVALEQKIADYMQLMEYSGVRASGVEKLRMKGRQLYDLLIGPASTELSASKRLTIIPDGGLRGLPFSSLPVGDGSDYLIHSVSVAYAVSERSWVLGRSAKARKKTDVELVVCGEGSTAKGTDWPSLRKRLVVLAKGVSGASLHLGADAGEGRFKAGLAGDVIVLSAPVRRALAQVPTAALYLSPDDTDAGLLTIGEIISEGNIDTSLLILSAVTQYGKSGISGDESDLLLRAWHVAGAPAVAVSDWIAETPTSGALLIDFVKALRAGDPKDVALQRAQIALSAAHPWEWSGLKVYGSLAALPTK